MSKRAEERGLEAYPNERFIDASYADMCRSFYQEGYEQAEKDFIDLAQLWVDSGDANVMSFQRFLKCHETQSNK